MNLNGQSRRYMCVLWLGETRAHHAGALHHLHNEEVSVSKSCQFQQKNIENICKKETAELND